MGNRHTIIHTEVTESDTYALLLGDDIPFLADVLQQQLEYSGCIVHTKPDKKTKYDYLLVFGAPANLSSEFSRLKRGGKAVFMITDEHMVESNDSRYPIVSLSSNKQFSAAALAETILKKLFTAQPIDDPYDIEVPDTTYEHKPKKKPAHEKKPKKPRKPLPWRKIGKVVGLTALFLLITLAPFLIFGSCLYISARNLNTLKETTLPLITRKKNIRSAQSANSVAHVAHKSFSPILSILIPDLEIIAYNGLNVLTQSALAANELLETEAVVAINAGSLKNPNADLFTTTLPDIQRRIATADQYLADAEISTTKLQDYSSWWFISNYKDKLALVPEARKILSEAGDIISITPSLLAQDTKKTYLILLQNNFELRPTGGFIGSYATMTVENGTVTHLSVEDVYEADGQLKGSVTPPDPIADYLNQPNWFLRDSNWEPDFSLSAYQAEWFLEKETGAHYDGVIAIDLYVIQNILRATGGIYVPDYQATVTADDFFLKLQTDTHSDFFPGSSKKRDLIAALASALMIDLTERSDLPHASLVRAIYASLKEKHILISVHDKNTQIIVDQHGWGGRIVEPSQQTTSLSPYRSDYLMLIEANLGVNKANYYIDREVFASLTLDKDTLYHEILIYYKNNSPYRKSFFSGPYKNYLRVLIPKESIIEEVSVGDTSLDLRTEVTVSEVAKKTSVGMLVTIEPQEEKKIVLKYELPLPPGRRFLYQFMVQKQPGTDHDPFVLKLKPDPTWHIIESTIPSIPYLSELSTDNLITVDFERNE